MVKEMVLLKYLTSESSFTLLLMELGYLLWVLVVGTFPLGEKSGTYGVAFWAAATKVRVTVTLCSQTWLNVRLTGPVK